MRSRRASLVLPLLAATTLGLAAEAAAKSREPNVTAAAAVVMDARTGELVWSRNPDEQRAPASTTKILTTVLALESGRLEETVRVSTQAQAQVPSKLYLRAGQTAKLRDLLYALMLKSANDAAVVVAEGVSGSVDEFAKRMTERARSVGARGSQFRNPSGLPNDAHLSTARDLGLILRHAVHVPGFVQVASVTSQRIPISNGTKQQWMALRTKNRLLQGYTVPVIGKTGYTRAAGRCFAGYAEKDGRPLIVVVLGSRDLWGDTRRLFDWGFAQPQTAPLPIPVQMAGRPVDKVAWLPPKESSPAPAKAAAPESAPAEKAVPEVAGERPSVVKVGLPDPARPARVRGAAPEPRPAPDRPSRDRRSENLAGPAEPARAAAAPASPPAAQRELPPQVGTQEKEPAPGRVILAMGKGSSTVSGRTYYDEFRSRGGMVRRGCTGSGCERKGGSGGR